jgi:hypothetical protein
LEPIPSIQLIQPSHQFLKTGVNICHIFHWPSMPTVLMTFWARVGQSIDLDCRLIKCGAAQKRWSWRFIHSFIRLSSTESLQNSDGGDHLDVIWFVTVDVASLVAQWCLRW